jgi:HAD superfamily hydrolase (TIGR01549 family)
MKTIIFDFDGTLGDTILILLKIYNDLADVHGLRHVEHKDWLRLRQGTFREGFKWSGMSPFQAPGMITQGLKMMEAHTSEVKLFPEMMKVVKHFKSKGYDLYVLSTNSDKVIKQVLDEHGYGDDLTVLKSSKVFGKSRDIKRLVKEKGLVKQDVWMVGDEARDMVAAKKAGVNGLAVTWGLQPEKMIKKVKGIIIVHTPGDVIKVIEG